MNLDYRLRADNSAEATTRTLRVDCLGGKITVFIGFFGDNDAAFRTYRYAQAAALAPLGIDYYLAGHKIQDFNELGRPCKEKSTSFVVEISRQNPKIQS